MKKLNVAVIFGGCSTEYEVSLQSAHAVITHMDKTRYEIVMLGITRQGAWLRYSGPVEKIADNTWYEDASCHAAIISPDKLTHGIVVMTPEQTETIYLDAVFPVLHGKNGEDGTIQGLLALAGIPCVGCGVLSSALCMDKELAHKIVSLAGIQTPRCVALQAMPSPDALQQQTASLDGNLFVKPANAGSSFGITRIQDRHELHQAVANAFLHDDKVVIEEEIKGFEVGCAILGNQTLTIGKVDEIELTQGFFDYTEKYTLCTSRIHMPARIHPAVAARIQQSAAVIYRALGCTGMARVDMFLTPEQEIVFNEVNTIPGFTQHSRYPNMLKGVGMDFSCIINNLIELAVMSA